MNAISWRQLDSSLPQGLESVWCRLFASASWRYSASGVCGCNGQASTRPSDSSPGKIESCLRRQAASPRSSVRALTELWCRLRVQAELRCDKIHSRVVRCPLESLGASAFGPADRQFLLRHRRRASPSPSFRGASQGSKLLHRSAPLREIGQRNCLDLGARTLPFRSSARSSW